MDMLLLQELPLVERPTGLGRGSTGSCSIGTAGAILCERRECASSPELMSETGAPPPHIGPNGEESEASEASKAPGLIVLAILLVPPGLPCSLPVVVVIESTFGGGGDEALRWLCTLLLLSLLG